jgi:hypothetical protein
MSTAKVVFWPLPERRDGSRRPPAPTIPPILATDGDRSEGPLTFPRHPPRKAIARIGTLVRIVRYRGAVASPGVTHCDRASPERSPRLGRCAEIQRQPASSSLCSSVLLFGGLGPLWL